MSKDTGDKSPYGAGFIAACIIVGAVLLCGAVLLISNPSSSRAAATGRSAQQQATAEPVESTGPDSTGPDSTGPDSTDPDSTGPDSVGPEPAGPATPVTSAGAGRSNSSTGCNRSAGDQAVPQQPPAVDGWEVSRRIVVPRSSTYGPATTDPDGFRRCFAHSPTGAVYAAYSAYAAMADQDKVVATAQKLMVPGPDTDALIQELRTDDSTSGYSVPQLAGYHVIDAGPDRVSLMLATPVDSAYMSLMLTLVWHDGDWRLQPPRPGEPVGAPFAQHRDLSDFVAWSGV